MAGEGGATPTLAMVPLRTFVVEGRPVPYVRMTTRSKWTARAQRYLAYCGAVTLRAREAGIRPIDGPVIVAVVVVTAGRGDLDNYVKAILDSLNGVAYADDRQVQCIQAQTRRLGKREQVEVAVGSWNMLLGFVREKEEAQ